LPFEGSGIKLAMHKLSSAGPEHIPVPEHARPWPDELTSLVLTMLRNAPSERPSSAYEVAQTLKDILHRALTRPSASG
jgi:hypothetical protein